MTRYINHIMLRTAIGFLLQFIRDDAQLAEARRGKQQQQKNTCTLLELFLSCMGKFVCLSRQFRLSLFLVEPFASHCMRELNYLWLKCDRDYHFIHAANNNNHRHQLCGFLSLSSFLFMHVLPLMSFSFTQLWFDNMTKKKFEKSTWLITCWMADLF